MAVKKPRTGGAAKKTAPKATARTGGAKKTAPKATARTGGAGKGASSKSKRRRAPASGPGGAKETASLGRPFPSARQAEILLNLEEALSRRIVGKDEAVAKIAGIVRVRMTHLEFRPDRPNGSFLLFGPTGVGKNEMAYAVSKALHGSEDRILSIDLGELAEEEDLAKLGVSLIPGSDTHVLEGILTSPVRRDPQAVILLRGLERVHPSFHPVLQQILERGRMDDIMGPVSFSDTVIFVTVRPRRDDPSGGEIGFSRTALSREDALRKRLEVHYSPDLLDTFNAVLELPPLTTPDVRRIARYKVEAVLQRLHRRHKDVVIEDSVFESLIQEDQTQASGASMINRTLEERLFNPLSRFLLSHRGARSLHVGIRDGHLHIREG